MCEWGTPKFQDCQLSSNSLFQSKYRHSPVCNFIQVEAKNNCPTVAQSPAILILGIFDQTAIETFFHHQMNIKRTSYACFVKALLSSCKQALLVRSVHNWRNSDGRELIYQMHTHNICRLMRNGCIMSLCTELRQGALDAIEFFTQSKVIIILFFVTCYNFWRQLEQRYTRTCIHNITHTPSIDLGSFGKRAA